MVVGNHKLASNTSFASKTVFDGVLTIPFRPTTPFLFRPETVILTIAQGKTLVGAAVPTIPQELSGTDSVLSLGDGEWRSGKQESVVCGRIPTTTAIQRRLKMIKKRGKVVIFEF